MLGAYVEEEEAIQRVIDHLMSDLVHALPEGKAFDALLANEASIKITQWSLQDHVPGAVDPPSMTKGKGRGAPGRGRGPLVQLKRKRPEEPQQEEPIRQEVSLQPMVQRSKECYKERLLESLTRSESALRAAARMARSAAAAFSEEASSLSAGRLCCK